jgi:hypothetical protein
LDCVFRHPGTVNGANNAEMRFLTVRNTGSGESCSSAIVNDSASPRLTHQTVESTGVGSGPSTINTHVGVFNLNSSAPMTDVTATASGATAINAGVYINRSSNPTIRDSKLSGCGGTVGAALWVESTGDPARVALSQLVGGVHKTNDATLQCFNYDANMAEVSCP